MIASHAGISPARLDIFPFQPRIPMKDCVGRITRSQHAKDMFDRQPAPSDNRLSTENLWVHRDPFEKELFIHERPHLRQ
jgi:hypothetical protein